MSPPEDFSSLFGAATAAHPEGAWKRIHRGDVVEGVVVQVGQDFVYVDVGGPAEARIDASELRDPEGNLNVAVGDRLRGTVIDARSNAPVLSTGLGRGTPLDASLLKTAQSTGTPVRAHVARAQKGGLELELAGGTRAFCPASHVEIGHVADLSVYEGQDMDVLILEIRDGGRDVIVSRRALLERQRAENLAKAREGLVPGTIVDGTVKALNKHGAVVDVGGIDAFIHISELANHRIERPEDAVSIGATVQARILAVESTDRGDRVRLSLKQAQPAQAAPAVKADEILVGSVRKVVPGGLVLRTERGEGFVPLRELSLAPGADHRRAYPVGKEMKVAVISQDPTTGRMLLSARGVAEIEERQNYETFGQRPSGASSGSGLGSLGDLLREHWAAQKTPEPERSRQRR